MSARRSARLSSQAVVIHGDVAGESPVVPASKKRAIKAKSLSGKAVAGSIKPSKKRKIEKSPALEDAPPSTPLRPTSNGLEAGSPSFPERADPVTPAAAVKSTNKTPGRRRPAQPHTTNAPLQTPGGSKLVRYATIQTPSASQAQAEPPTPSQWAMEDPVTGQKVALTTENLLEKAKKHLLFVDPSLKDVIEQYHCKMFDPDGLCEAVEPFSALARGIMGQQVSGAAAKAIENRFVALFPPPPTNGTTPITSTSTSTSSSSSSSTPTPRRYFPTPTQVLALDIPTLRSAGLSQRKAEYITGLAEKFHSGELSAQKLLTASDEEVMESLIAVRGLGRWSVEMFCCFGLKRMDVFSTGDLGVQRGLAKFLGRDVAKLKTSGKGKWKYLSEEEMVSTAERFKPFRSLFMWYMWRIEDVKLDVLEN